MKRVAVRWPLALLLVHVVLAAASLALLHHFKSPVFATIDDARLLYIYAGYASGEPTGEFVFSNALWGEMLAYLYRLYPDVAWYYLYHSVTLVLSNALTCFLITYTLAKSDRAIWWAFILCPVITFVVHYDASLLMHFEVTACLMGTAGISFLLVSDALAPEAPARPRGRIVWLLLSVLCMFFCMIQNKSVFYACSTFYAVVLAYVACKAVNASGQGSRLMTACTYVLTVVLIAGVFAWTRKAHSDIMGSAWDAYYEYNPYRVAFSDYSHSTYRDNPELFQSLRWSEGFFSLAQDRYYLDKRFSVGSLRQIVKPYNRTSSPTGAFKIKSSASVLLKMFRNNLIARFQFLGVVSEALLCIVLLRGRRGYRNRILDIALVFFTVCCAVILTAYLCWRGRLPLRAWETVALPAVIICSVATLGIALQPVDSDKSVIVGDPSYQRQRLGVFVDDACYIICLVALGYLLSRTPATFRKTNTTLLSRSEANRTIASFEAYAMDHPDDVFVYGNSIQNYNPLTLYANERPTNTMIWGTSYAFTPVWKDQIAQYGLDDFTSMTFAKDNVYFVCKSGKPGRTNADRLFRMLKRDYGFTSKETVFESEDGFIVVSFIRDQW